MDVTNPGVVNVASETYGNPDPNGGTARWRPRELDLLIQAAGEAFPVPPGAGASSQTFPTPDEIDVDLVPYLFPVSSTPLPDATEFNVDEQQLGQGQMVPAEPGNPAAGSVFRGPADFIVIGPAESFQTNSVEEFVSFTISAIYDADNLYAPPGPDTLRYYLVISTPPTLTSYPVSLLGRQVTFAGNVTPANEGAARRIQNYGTNFITINRDDESVSNGDVPSMSPPAVGDTFELAVNRQGSEQVNTEGETTNVFIFPPPPVDVPFPPQADLSQGTVDVSTELPPGTTIITSGTPAPTARNVNVSDQSAVVGLPLNVFA